jgi:hypothetical protein
MKLTHMLALGLLAATGLFASAPSAHAQATRTWVSGVGDDVNPCSRTSPCKTFAGAISKTAVGGEINCIDPGGFGTVTITKSITIDCGGTLGSILAAGTNGVVVNAANVTVTLRNITINGAGTGLSGVRFLQSGALRIENVKIFNFTQKGVDFVPTGNSEFFIGNSEVYNLGAGTAIGGINIAPTGSASAIATINTTTVQNNSAGILASTVGTTAAMAVTIRDSVVAGQSGTGITAQAGPALIMNVDRSAVTSNSTGIVSDGANALVQLNGSTVSANSTGLSLVNSGKITSFSSNVLQGNFVANGAPSTTTTLQ